MGMIGQPLRDLRELKGLRVEDVSVATNINIKYINAIENEDFDKFPAKVYSIAFLRNYATFLGADADKLIENLKQQYDEMGKSGEKKQQKADNKINATLIRVLIYLMVFLVILAGVYFYIQKPGMLSFLPIGKKTNIAQTSAEQQIAPQIVGAGSDTVEEKPESAEPKQPVVNTVKAEVKKDTATPSDTSARPVVDAKPEGKTEEKKGLLVEFEAVEEVWVSAATDDSEPTQRTFLKGEKVSINAKNMVKLEVGNVDNISVKVNGKTEKIKGNSKKVGVRTFTVK